VRLSAHLHREPPPNHCFPSIFAVASSGDAVLASQNDALGTYNRTLALRAEACANAAKAEAALASLKSSAALISSQAQSRTLQANISSIENRTNYYGELHFMLDRLAEMIRLYLLIPLQPHFVHRLSRPVIHTQNVLRTAHSILRLLDRDEINPDLDIGWRAMSEADPIIEGG
jgi:hypothetical protein